MIHEELTDKIIGCAYRVHNELGGGFLESIYHKSLMLELEAEGLAAASEVPIQVRYRDVVVGDFSADIQVEDKVIVEVKAVRELAKAHEVQLVNYLKATGMEVGLLINFGEGGIQFRRKHKDYKPPSERSIGF